MQRLEEGVSLAQLQRIFYGSGGSASQDALTLVSFLVMLGMAIRAIKNVPLGLFFWGPPGSGKTPLVHLMLRFIFGLNNLGIPELGEAFGLQSCLNARAIIIDEMRSYPSNSVALRHFKLICGTGQVRVNLKAKAAEDAEFSGVAVAVISNSSLSELFPKPRDLAAAKKRFTMRARLCNQSYNPIKAPLGFDMNAFEAQELGEVTFWALLASDRRQEVEQWAAQGLDWQRRLLATFEQEGQVSPELLRTLKALEKETWKAPGWLGVASQSE